MIPHTAFLLILKDLLGIKKKSIPKTINVGFSRTSVIINNALIKSCIFDSRSFPIRPVSQEMNRKLIEMIIASPDVDDARKSAIGFNARTAAPSLEKRNFQMTKNIIKI